MDPISIILNFGLGTMFFGALLWLYRLDRYGLTFLVAMSAMPVLIISIIVLLFILFFSSKFFAFFGLSLWWLVPIVMIPLSIKAIPFLYHQQHQKPESKWDLLKKRHNLEKTGAIKEFFSPKSNIQKTKDIIGEIIFVTTERWLFAFFYCLLILFSIAFIESKLAPFNPQKIDLISIISNPIEFYVRKKLISFWFYFVLNDKEWLFNLIGFITLIMLCVGLCWVHFRYLNWHAKRLYEILKEFSAELEKSNQYLIWYGVSRSGALILEIEDKLRWTKDYAFVRSNKYGEGFWLSSNYSFENFLMFFSYINRDGVEGLHKALKSK
jgi:hypothetical protein